MFKQTGTRYANAWHHRQPAWYYLQVILTLWLPGSLLLPMLFKPWWRRIRRGDRRQWLLLGWAVLVLVLTGLLSLAGLALLVFAVGFIAKMGSWTAILPPGCFTRAGRAGFL